MHVFHLSTWKAEVSVSVEVKGQFGLHSELQTTQCYILKSYLKTKCSFSWDLWQMCQWGNFFVPARFLLCWVVLYCLDTCQSLLGIGNSVQKIPLPDQSVVKTVIYFLNQWLMSEGLAHCGWCHTWAGDLGMYKKEIRLPKS